MVSLWIWLIMGIKQGLIGDPFAVEFAQLSHLDDGNRILGYGNLVARWHCYSVRYKVCQLCRFSTFGCSPRNGGKYSKAVCERILRIGSRDMRRLVRDDALCRVGRSSPVTPPHAASRFRVFSLCVNCQAISRRATFSQTTRRNIGNHPMNFCIRATWVPDLDEWSFSSFLGMQQPSKNAS